MPTYSASTYVVLGLLEQSGATTPYALDREIQQSIGHFWAFPRSQLYAEAARLARHGLVVEEQESSGRRRRTLSITPAGRELLAAWLTGPADRGTEIHDEGLLRLYFQRAGASSKAQVHRLAAAQRDAHRRKLTEYAEILAKATGPDALDSTFGPPQAAALAFGMRFEQLAIDFWTGIAERRPDTEDPRNGPTP